MSEIYKFVWLSPSLKDGVYFPKVNRVEVIDNVNGRVYTRYNVTVAEAAFQDDGRTLKLFVQYEREEEISDD